jgi:hypothetical protein
MLCVWLKFAVGEIINCRQHSAHVLILCEWAQVELKQVEGFFVTELYFRVKYLWAWKGERGSEKINAFFKFFFGTEEK